MGLARGVDSGFGIKQVVAEVLPQQQQDGRQQKPEQLRPAQRSERTDPPTRRQQHRHHGHGIHRPLDRGFPEQAPIGVTGCDSLRLNHGLDPIPPGDDPYI